MINHSNEHTEIEYFNNVGKKIKPKNSLLKLEKEKTA